MNKNFLEHNFILVPPNQEDIPLQKMLISTALSLKPSVVWYDHINLKKWLLDKPFLSRFGCVLVANLVWRGYTISLTTKENSVWILVLNIIQKVTFTHSASKMIFMSEIWLFTRTNMFTEWQLQEKYSELNYQDFMPWFTKQKLDLYK